MNAPRLAAALAAVVTCSLLLVSCSATGEPAAGTPFASGEGRPPATAAPEIAADGPAAVSLPLDPYFLPPAEEARLHTALDRLVAGCMRSHGLQLPARTDAQAPVLGRYERRYGLTSAAAARATGYHLPDRPDPTQVPLSPAQLNALTGPRGCQEAAARRITGTNSYPADAYAVRSANHESFDRSAKAPEVMAVVAAWSRCMKRAGYGYATPLQTGTWPSERATDEERTTALADVACKQKTGLVQVWSKAEAAIQRTLIQQNAAALDGVLAERRHMLRKADAVLPSSRTGR